MRYNIIGRVVWHDYSFNAVRSLAPTRCRNQTTSQ
nr:MAG TPA_asm: hypothetical protein [Caudoviricetes sp.]